MGKFCALIVVVLLLCACGRVGFDDLSVDSTTASLLPVPAGSFLMGCNSSVDSRCENDESPYRSITLAAFMIERTEVSQANYENCMIAGQCTAPSCDFSPSTTPDLPVVCVTWQQGTDYCQSLGRRLPTEAEWEKAARGADGRLYPWGNGDPDCSLLNWFGCPPDTDAVDGYVAGASPYGALNMAGNVWEWVNDYYLDSYYSSGPLSDPPGPATSSNRTRRGGSYISGLDLIRISNRYSTPPDTADNNVGIRCAQ